jgi:NAD-dependent dihydropyrimidine dehydrogenase PreA subunit
MKIVNFVSVVDTQKCNGDQRCENLCPAGAVKVLAGKARVNEGRCVACGKCVDVCRENAITLIRRDVPITIGFNGSSIDPEKVQSLCMNASLLPDLLVCACTGTQAGEIAAAIIGGAKSPEDIVTMTGAGSGCGIYCMGVIFKLFACAGIQIPKDQRWNSLPLTPADIPEEVVLKYPEYYFGGRV